MRAYGPRAYLTALKAPIYTPSWEKPFLCRIVTYNLYTTKCIRTSGTPNVEHAARASG